MNKTLLLVFLLLACIESVLADDKQKQADFLSVFGDQVLFEQSMREKVLSAEHGKRHYVDQDGDGKPEEVWFIDTDPRHKQDKRPLLVKVIDRDNDLRMGEEPDKDSDLWIADWNADGKVDAVISYEDEDQDNDVDQQALFFYHARFGFCAWWNTDDGDDNHLMMYDIDYVYYQVPCQNYSHFGGNDSFTLFYLDKGTYFPSTMRWIPFWENPFLFYDVNNDGVSEETIRIEGENETVAFLRWSFNLLPDAEDPRNYDVGITACAPGWRPENHWNSAYSLHLSDDVTESFLIAGIPTGRVLKRSTAKDYLAPITWSRVLFTWDEIDLNVAWKNINDTIPRWEGIIAEGYKDDNVFMPQVGGPACGPFNKRYELILHPDKPNEYYYNPAEQKIRIKYSDLAWIDVDFDGDRKRDMYYKGIDTDNDGIVDTIELDADGDGKTDDSWSLDISGVHDIQWEFFSMNQVYAPIITQEPEARYKLVQSLVLALESIQKGLGDDPVFHLLQNRFEKGGIYEKYTHQLIHSDESILYYLTLVQDRQIAKLKQSGAGNDVFWQKFNAARSCGNTSEMLKALNKEFKIKRKSDYKQWINELRKI
ncbi:hypothetical protein [Proteiniphilum sp.]|uniref:hypothetical protein n=1 Tax=Proteiniphilum sp. TaxID=1926877 RepID=UPI002B20309B|nr:hypothetical protein [Proteiniphilum sp.]MEA4917083.1 hypothetical protein [Proteiniphilum sp.]